ncbi:hypothetical protein NOCD_22285, partial [Nocardioides cavernae]|uniref:hypothetical protein n=1 Tax=Nocardioides cavernae TaxID=1921566 RepID=UPI00200DFE1E
LGTCVSNENDRASALIEACFGDGLNTWVVIINLGMELRFNPAHFAIVLGQEARFGLSGNRCWRIMLGRYSLLV